eukprot:gene24963-30158_t
MNSCTIFIEDLPAQMDEMLLQQILPPYFTYLAVKVRPVLARCPVATAHVVLDSFENAVKVADYLDGTHIMGRKIRVRLAVGAPRVAAPPLASPPTYGHSQKHNSQINSIYVRFSVASIDRIVSEADLVSVFSVYGAIEKVAIKEFSVDEKARRQYGYGFVHYDSSTEGVRSALGAISNVDNQTIGGIYFNVEASRNLMKQFNKELEAAGGGDMMEGGRGNTFGMGGNNMGMDSGVMGRGRGGGGIALMGSHPSHHANHTHHPTLSYTPYPTGPSSQYNEYPPYQFPNHHVPVPPPLHPSYKSLSLNHSSPRERDSSPLTSFSLDSNASTNSGVFTLPQSVHTQHSPSSNSLHSMQTAGLYASSSDSLENIATAGRGIRPSSHGPVHPHGHNTYPAHPSALRESAINIPPITLSGASYDNAPAKYF